MSREDARAALERIETDEALAASLREVGGPEASISLLRDAGVIAVAVAATAV